MDNIKWQPGYRASYKRARLLCAGVVPIDVVLKPRRRYGRFAVDVEYSAYGYKLRDLTGPALDACKTMGQAQLAHEDWARTLTGAGVAALRAALRDLHEDVRVQAEDARRQVKEWEADAAALAAALATLEALP